MRLRCALRTSYRIGCRLEGSLSIVDRVVGFVPDTEFSETVVGVRVLLLSVSGDVGSGGHGGSEPESVGGFDNPDDSPEAARVGTLGGGTPLLGCTLVGYTAGASAIGILTLVRYCLGTVLATSIEFSRLLLEALSPGNDAEGVAFKYCSESNSYTVLIALLRRLL